MIQCKAQKSRTNESQARGIIENDITLSLLELIVLNTLSQNKCVSKETIINTIKKQTGVEFTPDIVDALLDNLWFEEMICTEGLNGKSLYALTKKGIRKRISLRNNLVLF